MRSPESRCTADDQGKEVKLEKKSIKRKTPFLFIDLKKASTREPESSNQSTTAAPITCPLPVPRLLIIFGRAGATHRHLFVGYTYKKVLDRENRRGRAADEEN